MNDVFNMLKDFFGKAKKFSLVKKVLLVATIVLALVYALTSCTSTRSMAVTVDKAEKVDIHLTDSINGQLPFI